MGKRARISTKGKVKPVSQDKLIMKDRNWKIVLVLLAVLLFTVPYYYFLRLRSVEFEYQGEVTSYTTHRKVDSRNGSVGYAIIVTNTGEKKETFSFEVEDRPHGSTFEWHEGGELELKADQTDTEVLTLTVSEDTYTMTTYNFYVVVTPEHNQEQYFRQKLSVRVESNVFGSRVVGEGDRVRVDYTGFTREGLVFDSSVEAIGLDGGIPKFHSFSPRETYEPNEFDVGGVVVGFKNGLLGMQPGQSVVVKFPPMDGYGNSEGSPLQNEHLVFEIYLHEVL
jgi:FKBP-type peptidyl-prolyl cis-trans isomerase